VSFDGKIADKQQNSKWISGSVSLKDVHNLRRKADVVLAGAKTVLSDNSSLFPRPAGQRKTFRVITDTTGSLEGNLKVLNSAGAAQTIIATTKLCKKSTVSMWKQIGITVWQLPLADNHVSLPALLTKLGKMGMLHVLCEGGAELAASFIKQNLVDEYIFFIAPKIIGGINSISAIGGDGWTLSECPQLQFKEVKKRKNDIFVRALPKQN
jgi:diaminohydroxyphosphoribosylaminopyrimidine deaminase / 5-amino-6-(5-phosphoribosylamino)uracil reductase